MNSIKLAFRISVVRLVDFFKSDDNKKGNVTATFDVPQHTPESFALLDAAHVLEVYNAGLAENAKEIARGILADKDAIPETVDVTNAETRSAEVARLTSSAQSKISALTTVSLSDRSQKMQETALLQDAQKRMESGVQLDSDEMARIIAIALKR